MQRAPRRLTVAVLVIVTAACSSGDASETTSTVAVGSTTTVTTASTTGALPGFLPTVEAITNGNAASVELLATMEVPGGSAPVAQCSVDFGGGGDLLAAACGNEAAVIWNLATGDLEHTLDHGAIVVGIDFGPGRETVATGGFDGVVRLWDMGSGLETDTLDVHDARVWDVEFSPEGRFLGSIAFEDGDVVVWDLTGENPVPREFPMGGRGLSLSFDPAFGDLATGWIGGEVRLMDLASAAVVWETTEPLGNTGDVAFGPHGFMLAAGADDDRAWVWEVGTEEAGLALEGHDGFVNGVAFSPDGSLLATGSHDGTVGVWDLLDGAMLAQLEGHEDAVLRVAFSPDGGLIASTSWDGTVRLWGVPG